MPLSGAQTNTPTQTDKFSAKIVSKKQNNNY